MQVKTAHVLRGLKLILYPATWVAFEFMRDRFFTGFGWVSLGHSQYLFLPLIQVADITGVFGISFIVVMVNYFLKKVVEFLFFSAKTQKKKHAANERPRVPEGIKVRCKLEGFGGVCPDHFK